MEKRWVLSARTLEEVREKVGDHAYFSLDTAKNVFNVEVGIFRFAVHYTMIMDKDRNHTPIFMRIDCVNRNILNADALTVAASTGFEDGYSQLVEDMQNYLYFHGM